VNNAVTLAAVKYLARDACLSVNIEGSGQGAMLSSITTPDSGALDEGVRFNLSGSNAGLVEVVDNVCGAGLNTLMHNGIRTLGALAVYSGAYLVVSVTEGEYSPRRLCSRTPIEYSQFGLLPVD
jgi:hypothetical protein